MKIIVTDLAVVAPLSAKERAIVETLQKEKYDSNFRKSVEITLSSDKSKGKIVEMLLLCKSHKFEKTLEILCGMVLACLEDYTNANWKSCKKTFNKICNYDDWAEVVFEASLAMVLETLQEKTNNGFSGLQYCEK